MECRVLKAQLVLQNEQIEQLRDELQSIDWHIQFIKDGGDYVKLIKDHKAAKVRINNLEDEIIDIRAEHEKQLNKENKKKRELKDKIIEMNNNIIKPLIFEVFTKNELISRLHNEKELNVRDLKMMNTILRLPKMSTDFQRTLRQKNEEQRFVELQ